MQEKKEAVEAWKKLVGLYGADNPILGRHLFGRHLVELKKSKFFASGYDGRSAAQFYDEPFNLVSYEKLMDCMICFSMKDDAVTVYAGFLDTALFTITENTPVPVFAAVKV